MLGCNSSNEVFNNNNWYADYLESNGEEYYENEKDNLVEVLNREKLENFGIILVDMQPGFLYKIDYDNDDENHRKVFFGSLLILRS